MNDNYIQNVEINIKPNERKMQISGMALCLISLGFILLAAFYSLYYLIGLVAFFAAGMTLIQIFASTAKQYEYNFNTKRLIVSKTNKINRKFRFWEIATEDIIDFGLFNDFVEHDDVVICDDTKSPGVYYIKFCTDNKIRRLLFTPDDYMLSLIRLTLKSDIKQAENAADSAR